MKISFTHVIHIIPLADLRLHDGQMDCWCFPVEVSPSIWVHNAKDCREAKERHGLKGSRGWVLIGEKV